MAIDAGSEPVSLAIDLGGTRIRVGVIAADGKVLRRQAFATPSQNDPESIISLLADRAMGIRQGVSAPILALGVAAPGPLDPATGTVLDAPNFPGWTNVPLAAELERRTGLLVVLGNDANLAGLGEIRAGAARGHRDVVYLTVSTGVGSGIFIDGRPFEGRRGVAAEAGHMTVSMAGPRCSCGNSGCLEAFASGTSLVRRAQDGIREGQSSILAARIGSLTARDVAAAADAGDPLAQALIHEAGEALGFAIRTLLHLFDPTIVVIGGGVSRAGRLLWDPMLRVVAEDAFGPYRRSARIVPAELGDDSGLIGAGLFAHSALSSSARSSSSQDIA